MSARSRDTVGALVEDGAFRLERLETALAVAERRYDLARAALETKILESHPPLGRRGRARWDPARRLRFRNAFFWGTGVGLLLSLTSMFL